MFGGARGPGMIFVIPCIDTYRKIDLRCSSFRLVGLVHRRFQGSIVRSATAGNSLEGLRDRQCGCRRVLPNVGPCGLLSDCTDSV